MLRRLTFAIVFTVLASVEIVAQQNSDLVGSYLFRHEWGGTKIVLTNNGTFTWASSDCTSVTTRSGPYAASNNEIRFTMLKLKTRSFSDMKEHDLTKRKARKKYLDTDEPFKPETYELQIVRWGERVYLLGRKSFGSFVAAINLGFEPRSVDGYRAYYGDIYLRVGDENKPVTGPPPLPEELLLNLLPAPVIATVIEIKTEGRDNIATIDRGSADGLKLKMGLVSTTPTAFYESYWITSIAEHSAQFKVWNDVKVGDQLTTRIPDVSRYAE